ncbi:MAG: glycosyltransferase [Pirellulaceae bacterium]
MPPEYPLISVILPVYNAERYVREAVESILRQTYQTLELIALIAVDDDSTDSSFEILEELAAADDRLRLFTRPSKACTQALNLGIDLARGDWIARMDADDIAFPQRFEEQLRYLQNHESVVAVGSSVILIDGDGDEIGEQLVNGNPQEIADSILLGMGGLMHPTVMMRTEALKQVGGYREKFQGAEDQDLWLRLNEIGEVTNIPDPLLYYRVHQANFSFQNHERCLDQLRAAIEDAYRRRGIAGPVRLGRIPPPTSAWERRLAWAWSAINTSRRRTALKYAIEMIRERPACRNGWVVACHAIGGKHAEWLHRLLTNRYTMRGPK